MQFFTQIEKKIFELNSKAINPVTFHGIELNYIPLLLSQFLNSSGPFPFKDKSVIIIAPSTNLAEKIYREMSNLKTFDQYLLTSEEYNRYSTFIFPEDDLIAQLSTLASLSLGQESNLSQNNQTCTKRKMLIVDFQSFISYYPPKAFLLENKLQLQVSQIFPISELAEQLTKIGYLKDENLPQRGSFFIKGEIVDIYPLHGPPLRLGFFDEMIEEIYAIDPVTFRKLDSKGNEVIELFPLPGAVLQDKYVDPFKLQMNALPLNSRGKIDKRRSYYSALNDRILPTDYTSYFSLFFNEKSSLADYLPDALLIKVNCNEIEKQSLLFQENAIKSFENCEADSSFNNIMPAPNYFYNFNLWHEIQLNNSIFEFLEINLNQKLSDDLDNTIDVKLVPFQTYLNSSLNYQNLHDRHVMIKNFFIFLTQEFKSQGTLIFAISNKKTADEIRYLLQDSQLEDILFNRIHYISMSLDSGFFYPAEKILVITEADIFSQKIKRAKKKSSPQMDIFAEQLATLKKNDYVVHQEFGIGIYQGLQTMEFAGQKSDFVEILYENNDKVYLPIYKLNLIQKYADSESNVAISSLKNQRFLLTKRKAKESVKKLAFDLLKIQAARESTQSFTFSAPDHLFKEFELAFPFEETQDQEAAIENVLLDMQKNRPMDRLICGDVGFGKTEVAMRAAFLASLNQKQVLILVPTTILALQHFHSFKKRFANFPVIIDSLSRLRSSKERSGIIKNLKEGKIDILIGTHSLLSEELIYKDLGLVIVDEEQRFGVSHKEKLKLLKHNVDFLTLTATPIPRTLQFSFMGLKELSLIQTPPPRRQSIKTFIIQEDDNTLREAITFELERGGQLFFVHNKVHDIETQYSYIKKIVPHAKVIIAHGQLSARELESRVQSFYEGRFDILLATTIIESGIDIPNANTMIVNNAHCFGLSQLHQLRGRIGRSDRKAYAYLIVPQNKNIADASIKRLKALQTYSELGSGFSIASCDLELRGSGDILGAEQSGHINAIGLELYLELLQEAIAELKNIPLPVKIQVEMNVPFPAYIPDAFITSSPQRLKFYKKIANCSELETLIGYKDEIIDIYGKLPFELDNLFKIIEVRIRFFKLKILSVKVVHNQMHLKFSKEELDSATHIRDSILKILLARPNTYTVRPDFSVICKNKINFDINEFYRFALNLAGQII